MIKDCLFFVISVYFCILIAQNISYITTGFIRPNGLWNLVPFRVSAWKSRFTDDIDVINWAWEEK